MRNTVIPIALICLFAACKKDEVIIEPEKPITKTMEYHVFAAKDYSNSSFDNVKAEVRLSVGKVNSRTGETTLIWDSTFIPRNMGSFPLKAQKLIVEKQFSGYSSKEKLNISYSIRYNYNNEGYLSHRASGEVIEIGKTNNIIEVGL
jgi:hypothetical protein